MNQIQSPRRSFLKLRFGGFAAVLSLGLCKRTFAKSPFGGVNALVVHDNEGKRIIMGRSKAPMTIKISAADHGIESVSFCTEDIVPGQKISFHKHLNNDVHAGGVRGILRGEWYGSW